MCWSSLPLSHAQPGTAAPEPAVEVLVLEVILNDQPLTPTRPVLRRAGRLLFNRADLRAWRLALPAQAALRYRGEEYDDLGPAAESAGALDEGTQTARLTLPAQAFEASRLSAAADGPPLLSPAVPGAFLNYELAVERSRRGSSHGALVEGVVTADWGLASTSAVLGRPGGEGPGSLRLDSALRRDDPQQMTRLTVGDAITQNVGWSTPMRFGGVQFGTDFGLRPGFVRYPTPSLAGGSGLPSTLEAYVNDTLRYQGRVDAGPFALDNVPVLTGAGEMRFVVRDALGVQRSVVTPYYVSSALLRPGLSEWSVELGWNRRNYALASFDYGKPFAAGTWRRGLDPTTTVEIHGQANARGRTAGAGVLWVWAPWGEFGLHGAASDGTQGRGSLWRASFAHIAPGWSVSASRQAASRGFMQLAWQEARSHVRTQDQLFAGVALGQWGSVGAGFTGMRYDTGEAVRVVSLNWSIAVGSRGFLNTYLARTHTPAGRTTTAGLTLSFAFGERGSASVGVQQQNGRHSVLADVQQTPPPDRGVGWRVSASRGETDRSHAEWTWRTPAATLVAQAADVEGSTHARLLASGSLGLAGGTWFAANRSDDAYALVTVPGAAGITVLRENQPVAVTDAGGRAFVPGLRAYEPNRLAIDHTQLPIGAGLSEDTQVVVPRFKGVARATFEVRRALRRLLVLHDPHGMPMPPGTELADELAQTTLLVGYGGQVELEDPRPGQRWHAGWQGRRCAFTLPADIREDDGTTPPTLRCEVAPQHTPP